MDLFATAVQSRKSQVSKKMERKFISIGFACALSAAVVLVILNRETILNEVDKLFSDEKRAGTLLRLERIAHAISLVQVEASRLEKSSHSSSNSNSESSLDRGSLRIALAQLSSDVDYILAELDQIRGDDKIKSKRKELVTRTNTVVERVEKLTKILAE